MIKGLFSKDQIRDFLFPLQILSSILDTSDNGGIILNFDPNTKEINIYTKKVSMGMMIYVKYKNLINTFELDEEKIGIYNLVDFIKYFSIIDDDNTEIEYKDKVFCIKTNDCELNFRTADSSIIQELGKKFSFSDWSAEIEINENFKKLQKAIKLLPDEKYIYIKGDIESKKLNFTVKKSESDSNSFKSAFDCDVKKDVSIIINKDYFQIAESTKCKKMTLKIADRFICVECENDNSIITFFIAKVS